MRDTVNLNQTRINLLDESAETIKTFLKGSGYGAKILRFADQGSWAHSTIIKPLPGKAFDADLVMFVEEVEGWEAKDYINNLALVFRSSETYKSKTKSFSHCATIEYVGERKLDIAPCVINRNGFEQYEVCNRTTNQFEQTDAEAYTGWVKQRNVWSKGNSLKKSVRLIKYLKDTKTTFTCQPVLLTTLLGERINLLDEYSNEFSDTPTALKFLMGRLDDWLQNQVYVPIVANPVLVTVEDFARGWDQKKFNNFQDQIHRYREWIDQAYDEENRNDSIAKWRRVFGADFAKGIEIEEASTTFSKSSQALVLEGIRVPDYVKDVVDLIVHFGAKAIPTQLAKLPYLEEPTWPIDKTTALSVRVRGMLHSSKLQPASREVDLSPMQKGQYVRFEAVNNVGLPFPNDFTIKWRIANTGAEAVRKNCLRGGFVPSEPHCVRWEELSYRGIHFVEAFVIRNRDGMQVGKSGPFCVVIE